MARPWRVGAAGSSEDTGGKGPRETGENGGQAGSSSPGDSNEAGSEPSTAGDSGAGGDAAMNGGALHSGGASTGRWWNDTRWGEHERRQLERGRDEPRCLHRSPRAC